LENVGNNYGPDLTQLDKTWGGKEVLKELLAPSERINEKFQSYVFTTATGKIITGLILEEKDDHVKIIENPLSKAEPIILKKIDIESKDKSATSLMPKGLLDKLSKDEILDLIAYVLSKGNAESELFHKAGHQHGKR
jgi:putative heme-binding domain-containing protein